MSPAPRQRQPWPMKWIVLAIVLGIGSYTFLTVHYRKPGHSFEPYADIKSRVNNRRLLDAGYHRVTLETELPSDPTTTLTGPDAPTTAAAAGLPAALRDTLVDQPQLPDTIVTVAAAPSVSRLFTYPIGFRCTLADNKRQLAGADLYVRGHEIVVAPDFEHLAGALLSRTRESAIRLTVPAGALKPGSYRVTLAGAHASRAWTLQVH